MSLQFPNPECGHMGTADAPCNCRELPGTKTQGEWQETLGCNCYVRRHGHVGQPTDIPDVVEHPAHYTTGPIETIEIIEALDLPYHLSAVVKYLARYRFKGKPLEDLRKARWYLDRFITHLERQPRVDK